MDILITHLLVTAAIGFVVLLGLACIAGSLWGAYALAYGGVAKFFQSRAL